MAQQTNIEPNEWPYSPKFHDFANFLGLSGAKDSRGIYWRGDEKTAGKVEEIYKWGQASSGSDDHTRIKTQISKLQRNLGTNMRGKSLIDLLWQYTAMNTQVDHLKEEIGRIEGKPVKQSVVGMIPPPPKPIKSVELPKVKPTNFQEQVTKATSGIKKKVEKETRKAVKQAIDEGIKAALN